MLKPHYFIENQSGEGNRHDQLAPAMSTLIIIGHVKDGADLAREHHLPEPIIDFIEQHHGTTLVEYFYHGAAQQKNELSYSNLQESAFRYPGPKPQTKEAGVLMLADCVESASRTLSEPTPARIERLVEELAMKQLLDGQFNESGLDLKEVREIQDSLIKSLTSVYHGRIKYPQQRTA
jgi:membrane-associated HD superfamily phosphohydrolase